MEYDILKYVFVSVQSPDKQELCFSYHRMSHLYLQRVWVLLHRDRHVATPPFEGKPEQTNQTLAPDADFRVFRKFFGHRSFSYMLLCSLQVNSQMPLNKFCPSNPSARKGFLTRG